MSRAMTRKDLTVEVVAEALERHGGSYVKAAAELGATLDTLRRRVPGGQSNHRKDITLERVVKAIEQHGTLTAAGEALGCSPTTVRDRLVAGGRPELVPPRVAMPRSSAPLVAAELPPPVVDDVVANWRDLSACLEHDPELFFPISETNGPGRVQVAEAKAVCAGCPVIDACRTWVLASGEHYGIWAGMTSQERLNARRRASRQPAGAR